MFNKIPADCLKLISEYCDFKDVLNLRLVNRESDKNIKDLNIIEEYTQRNSLYVSKKEVENAIKENNWAFSLYTKTFINKKKSAK
jgi:hypothetical protein